MAVDPQGDILPQQGVPAGGDQAVHFRALDGGGLPGEQGEILRHQPVQPGGPGAVQRLGAERERQREKYDCQVFPHGITVPRRRG